MGLGDGLPGWPGGFHKCVLTARITDERPVSLNMASARNLRFLDREKEIVYPWTRESWSVGKSDRENEKEQMI